MTEADTCAWLQNTLSASADQCALLGRYAALLVAENTEQNLISAATVPMLWDRHIRDSAQLLLHAGCRTGIWLDIGSGPGLPGLVIACLSGFHVRLVEPRARRADFLRRASDALGLTDRVSVEQAHVQSLRGRPADVISARAVAGLDQLIGWARHLSTADTLWILPKGRQADSELAQSRHARSFHVERSVTDADAGILLGRVGSVT